MDKHIAGEGTRNGDAEDRAIDRAVRELMHIEPRADLRARVIEQIEHRTASVGRFRPSVGRVFRPGVNWVVVPLAAAALFLAIMLRWPDTRPKPRPASDIVLSVPAMSREPQSTTTPAPAAVRVARRADVQGRDSAARVMPVDAARPVVQLDPLEPIGEISVAPVTVPSLNAQQITIPPLAPLAQIELEPVNPSDQRN